MLFSLLYMFSKLYFYFILWNNYKSKNYDFVYIDFCVFLFSVI